MIAFELPPGRLRVTCLGAHPDDVEIGCGGTLLELAPSTYDAHQDHRLVGELAATVWRDALVLRYEIPKWDGDLGRATHYVPLPPGVARQKVDLLHECFPSQSGRDWWDDETFFGLMRLRGVECRATYAEAFVVDKAVVRPTRAG